MRFEELLHERQDDFSEELHVFGCHGEAGASTETRGWLGVLHVVRRFVDIFEKFLEKTERKALLHRRHAHTTVRLGLV